MRHPVGIVTRIGSPVAPPPVSRSLLLVYASESMSDPIGRFWSISKILLPSNSASADSTAPNPPGPFAGGRPPVRLDKFSCRTSVSIPASSSTESSACFIASGPSPLCLTDSAVSLSFAMRSEISDESSPDSAASDSIASVCPGGGPGGGPLGRPLDCSCCSIELEAPIPLILDMMNPFLEYMRCEHTRAR